MHYKVHDFDNARRRMQQQLIRMGWVKRKCPYPTTDKVELRAEYDSPHVENLTFSFENHLKKINPTGEAYYALEMRCYDIMHLAWRCNQNNPNNRHPLDTLDAFGICRNYMLNGLTWDYGTKEEDSRGTIKVIDWEHPEQNTFEFVEGWRGALNDGFGWDFVLLVNAIPLGGIVIEAGDSCQEALDLAQYQLDKDFQFPVYCHTLVVSNGEKMMMGDPWMELDEFQEIGTLKEALRPVDYLMNRIKTIPE